METSLALIGTLSNAIDALNRAGETEAIKDLVKKLLQVVDITITDTNDIEVKDVLVSEDKIVLETK